MATQKIINRSQGRCDLLDADRRPVGHAEGSYCVAEDIPRSAVQRVWGHYQHVLSHAAQKYTPATLEQRREY